MNLCRHYQPQDHPDLLLKPCNFHGFNGLYTFTPSHWAFAHLYHLNSLGSIQLCLLGYSANQSTVPSPVSLFTSLIWRGCGITYVRLAEGPHYDRLSWYSNPWPSDHCIAATVAQMICYPFNESDMSTDICQRLWHCAMEAAIFVVSHHWSSAMLFRVMTGFFSKWLLWKSCLGYTVSITTFYVGW